MRAYRPTAVVLLTLGLLGLSPLAASAAEPVDLSVTVSDSRPGARADEPVPFNVIVQSSWTGTSEAVGDVAVAFTVPEGARVVGTEVDDRGTTTCTGARCVITGMQGGGHVVLAVLVAVPAAGTWSLTATLEPRATADPDASNDTASGSADVLAPLPPGAFTLSSLPAVIAYGDVVRSQGTLRLADGRVSQYSSVYLETRAPGATEFGPAQSSASTDAAGRFGVQLDTAAARDYRWSWTGDAEHGRTYSAVIAVRPVVRPRVTMDPVRVPPGGTSTIVATVAGPVAGRTASFQRYDGRKWVAFAHRSVTRPGTLRVPAARLGAGTHRFRVVVSGADSVPSGQGILPVSMYGKGDARAFSFLQESRPGVPIRWNPCAAIGYRVNGSQAPAGGVADVHESLRRVALASGLVFRYLGSTTHIPQDVDDPRNPAQLTIAWARPGQSRMMPPGPAGVGGAVAEYVGRGYRFTMGAVVLNSTERLAPGFGRGATVGSLVMHEVAHVVGLDHVASRSQIMEPVMDNGADAAMWGAGDLQGLKRLGRAAGCL